MKTILSLICGAFMLVSLSNAQINTLTSTVLSGAILSTDKVITVASATNVNAPSLAGPGSQLYVVAPGNQRGELMVVKAISGTKLTVSRGASGAQSDFPNNSLVLVGAPNWFYVYDPSGGCTAANTYVSPWVNTANGSQWLCSTITSSWVPGWNNTSAPAGTTALVASAAGFITPSGPLFHVSGTSAITGFTFPVGYNGGTFAIIPDAIFTTTAANNIALATTAVVGKAIIYNYDPAVGKFYPSY